MRPSPEPPSTPRAVEPNPVGPYWSPNIFDVLLASKIERQIQLALQVIVSGAGNQHAARFAKLFQPGRHVHAVAQKVVAFDNHVTKIDADAKDNAFTGRSIGLQGGALGLDRDGATHCVYGRAELRK